MTSIIGTGQSSTVPRKKNIWKIIIKRKRNSLTKDSFSKSFLNFQLISFKTSTITLNLMCKAKAVYLQDLKC